MCKKLYIYNFTQFVECLLETTWKQARNETFKVHEMEQSY
jgi:hypothetical protein